MVNSFLNIEIPTIRPSKNIQRLEKVLNLPILKAIQSDINNHIEKLNNGEVLINSTKHTVTLKTTTTKDNFKVALVANNGKTTTSLSSVFIKNGLPYIKKPKQREQMVLGSVKTAFADLEYNKLFLTVDKLNNLLNTVEQCQSLINKLIQADLKRIKTDSELTALLGITNIIGLLSYDEDYITKQNRAIVRRLKKNYIITTIKRYQNFKKISKVRNYSLMDLIEFELTFYYLKRVNIKYIVFWSRITIKRIFMPNYLVSLEKNKELLKLCGRMKLEECYIKKLFAVPKSEQAQLISLLYKYQLGYLLLDSLCELKQLDTQNYLNNYVRPKLVKELIIKFYLSKSIVPITEGLVTKILRRNVRMFATVYEIYTKPTYVCLPSFEIFLMTIFSDMPQVELLKSPVKNRAEIANYASCFLEVAEFFFAICGRDSKKAITAAKATLKRKLNYDNFKKAVHHAHSELERVADLFDNFQMSTIYLKLSQVDWSLKKFNLLHDKAIEAMEYYNEEYKKISKHPEKLAHLNHKVIVSQKVLDFQFTQLTSSTELNAEGREMKHCVGSYFGSNLYQGLFIFKVEPVQGSLRSDINNYSTLAIYIKNKTIHIQQNYSFCNNEPTKINQEAVAGFINILKKDHLEKFIDYSVQATKIAKLKDHRSVNEMINMDKYANELFICVSSNLQGECPTAYT